MVSFLISFALRHLTLHLDSVISKTDGAKNTYGIYWHGLLIKVNLNKRDSKFINAFVVFELGR